MELLSREWPRMKAHGISAIWPGMKTPNIMQVKMVSDPRKRHFERT